MRKLKIISFVLAILMVSFGGIIIWGDKHQLSENVLSTTLILFVFATILFVLIIAVTVFSGNAAAFLMEDIFSRKKMTKTNIDSLK